MRYGIARRMVASFGSVLLGAQLLSGCADTTAQDLCSQYDDLVVAAQKLRDEDPAKAKVEDLRAAADEVQAELDQVQAVAEGRLDDAISRLRADVDAVRQAAVDAGTEALETARPMIQDALDRVEQAWSIVQDLAEKQCPKEG